MLKPTKTFGELLPFTFQIVDNKGADHTAQMHRLVCILLFASNKVRVFHVKAHIMLKPKLPGLPLATHLYCINHIGILMFMSGMKKVLVPHNLVSWLV